MQLKYVKTAWL